MHVHIMMSYFIGLRLPYVFYCIPW